MEQKVKESVYDSSAYWLRAVHVQSMPLYGNILITSSVAFIANEQKLASFLSSDINSIKIYLSKNFKRKSFNFINSCYV